MLNADIIRKDDDRYQVMAMVDNLQNVLPSMSLGLNPEILELGMAYRFFLGWSADHSIWMLWAVDVDDPTGQPRPDHLVAWLTDPPEKNLEAITDGLIELFCKARQRPWITDDDIRATLETLDFSIPTVETLLTGAPDQWRPLPARFGVHFALSEGWGVNREMFLSWQRQDADSIIATLAEGRRDGILLIYTLQAENVMPMEPYEVDWPLLRRGNTPPQAKAGKEAQRLCRIYQHVERTVGFGATPPAFDSAVIRLAVSGKTPDDAIRNWYAVAKPLRRALRQNHLDPARTR
tara:strand:+ start:36948 stop:37823 length:876 start_codon:yes stop_codon:yes gene_type:complete